MFLDGRKQGRRRGFRARLTWNRPVSPTLTPRKSRTQCDGRQRASSRRFGGRIAEQNSVMSPNYNITQNSLTHSPYKSAQLSGYNQTIGRASETDRKSTRLNSSHLVISYAVF